MYFFEAHMDDGVNMQFEDDVASEQESAEARHQDLCLKR